LEKSYDSIPAPRIAIFNLTGKIIVKGWDKPAIRAVLATPSPRVVVDTQVLPSSGQAEKVVFSTRALDSAASGGEQTVDFELQVPLGSSLEIRNGVGSVQISGVQGETSVESASPLVAVTDAGGRLSVRTFGSDIEIVRPAGRVEAHSISGNLHFVNPTAATLRGNTTSGRIIYEGDFPPGADYSLSSYSGDIDVFCGASASFELRAKTVRGKVFNELPPTSKRRQVSPLPSAQSLLGTHNAGAASLELTSFAGSIRVRPRP